MKVVYIGLGRIGLPQALVSADNGHMVYGVDHNKAIVSGLMNQKVPFFEPLMEEILNRTINNTFIAYSDITDLPKKVDLVFFTLGTGIPVYPEKLDLTDIENLLGNVIKHVDSSVYIFRTTLPVGTVDALAKKFPDIEIAFVPERLVEGDAISEEKKLPKIIGAYSDESFNHLNTFFGTIGGEIVRVKNPRTAEFCKLTDNSYRNLIFSFSNDIAIAAENNQIDVYEVIRSVNYGYERNNIMRPGLVSGYCLGKDPYIFEYSYPVNVARGHSVIHDSRVTNDHLYHYIVDKIDKIKPASISILGLSFKADVDDFRMSHSLSIINEIYNRNKGVLISVYDPYININQYTNQYNNSDIVSISDSLNDETLYAADVIVILTPHKDIVEIGSCGLNDLVGKKKPYIIDVWNSWSSLYGEYEKYYAFGRSE